MSVLVARKGVDDSGNKAAARAAGQPLRWSPGRPRRRRWRELPSVVRLQARLSREAEVACSSCRTDLLHRLLGVPAMPLFLNGSLAVRWRIPPSPP